MLLAMEKKDKAMTFGSEFPDGRLCERPCGAVYHFREAVDFSEKLGRPLTAEEYEKFRIKEM